MSKNCITKTTSAFTIIILLIGCGVKQPVAGNVGKEADRLYSLYLSVDLDQARQSLESTVKLLEDSDLKPWGRANSLFLTYARLYVLEKRSGHESQAEIDFIKARYWLLLRQELGKDPVNCVCQSVNDFTPDKCVEFVDKTDKGNNDGNTPKYFRTRASQP